jgi:uncharacterized Zn-finger protein
MSKEEAIIVKSHTVPCNGGALGHPQVYLNVEASEPTTCPYCSQKFILDPKATAGHGH